jgi:hypothetical protein
MDFLLPFREKNLRRFAHNNDVRLNQYRGELIDSIDKPTIFWTLLFHVLGVVFTLSGISYLLPSGILPAPIHLGLVVSLFLVSLFFYLIL